MNNKRRFHSISSFSRTNSLAHLIDVCLVLIAAAVWLNSGCGARSDPPHAVFLGSSGVSNWDLAASFSGKAYVNRGVGGDTSEKMLARFQTAVLDLKPHVVVIWAGENDIEQNLALSATQSNIQSMHQQAGHAGIGVVFCTLGPKTGKSASQNSAIVAFNDWLRSFAASSGAQLADFYPVLADEVTGLLNPQYARTDEELNAAGYAAITPVAASAIAAATK